MFQADTYRYEPDGSVKLSFVSRTRQNRTYGGINQSQHVRLQRPVNKQNDRSSCRKLLTSLSEEEAEDRTPDTESPWQRQDSFDATQKTFTVVYTANGQCVNIVPNSDNNSKCHSGTTV